MRIEGRIGRHCTLQHTEPTATHGWHRNSHDVAAATLCNFTLQKLTRCNFRPQQLRLRTATTHTMSQLQQTATLENYTTSSTTLRYTAAHCNKTPTTYWKLLHAATHTCNTMQHAPGVATKTFEQHPQLYAPHYNTPQHIASHSNTQQRTATHSITEHHTATHSNTQQHTATHYNTNNYNTNTLNIATQPQHTAATTCNTLQQTPATQCNTHLQHNATHTSRHNQDL